MKTKIIVPSGYMGSGSSAITDLFSEVKGVNAERGTFEFVFLHCPNGLFDLEDKLLIGNNALRSDEALHSFAHTMKQLYDKKYWWVGHYQQNVGMEFWNTTKDYIEQLVEFKPQFYWYYQENVPLKKMPHLIWNKLLTFIPGGKKHYQKTLSYSPMLISYITPERFYEVSSDYIYKVFDMMGSSQETLVLDQLLLPYNLHRFDRYFKDDVEVFVVERDPRDVFITNKYYWAKQNVPIPYPTDVEEFCAYYKKMRKMEKDAENEHIHRIQFEDLIYRYEETVNDVFSAVGVQKEQHIRKRQAFDPEKSMNNTQLFLANAQYKKECEIIEKELQPYLYTFPYEIKHEEKNIF